MEKIPNMLFILGVGGHVLDPKQSKWLAAVRLSLC